VSKRGFEAIKDRVSGKTNSRWAVRKHMDDIFPSREEETKALAMSCPGVRDNEQNYEVFHNLMCADTLNALILIDFGFCKRMNEEEVNHIKHEIHAETAWREGERVTNFIAIIPNLLAIIQRSHQASWDARAPTSLIGRPNTGNSLSRPQQHRLFGWINTNSLREKKILSSCLSYYLRQQGDNSSQEDMSLRHSFSDAEEGDVAEEIGSGTLDLSKIRGGRIKQKKKTRKRRRVTRNKRCGKRKYLKASRRRRKLKGS